MIILIITNKFNIMEIERRRQLNFHCTSYQYYSLLHKLNMNIYFNNMHHQQQNTLYLKGCRFCEENFLRCLDFCYVNPSYHKLKPSLYYRQ